jgi:hypothetical protein
MMRRIIVKALQKRNETGPVSPSASQQPRPSVRENIYKRRRLFPTMRYGPPFRLTLLSKVSLGRLREAWGNRHGFSNIPADRLVQKYTVRTAKSVQAYTASGTSHTWISSNNAMAIHEHTVTARHPPASRQRRRHLVMRAATCSFS